MDKDKDRIYERVLGVTWIPSVAVLTFYHQGLEEVLGADEAPDPAYCGEALRSIRIHRTLRLTSEDSDASDMANK